jgi:hypothetical protein
VQARRPALFPPKAADLNPRASFSLDACQAYVFSRHRAQALQEGRKPRCVVGIRHIVPAPRRPARRRGRGAAHSNLILMRTLSLLNHPAMAPHQTVCWAALGCLQAPDG